MEKMMTEPRVAIVCDPLDTLGGKEKVVRQLLLEFPNAKVFTARSDANFLRREFPNLKVHNSFIQYFPFEKQFRKELLLLYPLAYRAFGFKKFDIVISVSDAFAKYIKPRNKNTKHIGYIITPPRFFWLQDKRSIRESDRLSFKIYDKFRSTFLEKIWKDWDVKAARNIDYPISISNEIAKRVKKYYGLESTVIYPPVDMKEMKFVRDNAKRENWFLYFGRVETYKGVELAIRACAIAHTPLKIAGVGQHMEKMQELVKDLNAKGIVKFLGFPSDEFKIELFSKCRALLFPVQNEDFGIVAVEANATGAAVIAYKSGGVIETISEKNPKTGILFDEYTPEALAKILETFNIDDFDPNNCRKQASNFANEIFRYKMKNLVNDVYQDIK